MFIFEPDQRANSTYEGKCEPMGSVTETRPTDVSGSQIWSAAAVSDKRDSCKGGRTLQPFGVRHWRCRVIFPDLKRAIETWRVPSQT